MPGWAEPQGLGFRVKGLGSEGLTVWDFGVWDLGI